MKTKTAFLTLIGILMAFTRPSFAIEGLTISIECTNVVLRWPSVEGETYIVQHRASLDTNETWETLTNFYPAFSGTNWTTFVHFDQVTCIDTNYSGGGTNIGGGPPDPSESLSANSQRAESRKTPIWELEERKPEAWEAENRPPFPWEGEEFNALRLFQSESFSLAQPESNGPEAGNGEPEMGFYQVVRNGVHILSATSLTNGVLSGTVPISFEAGNLAGTLQCAVIFIDGVKFAGDGVLSAPLTYPWQFQLDTAFLENGDHSLQIETTWHNVETSDDTQIYPGDVSEPVYITVTNQIYYPQWEPEIGETDIAAFFLKTVDPEAPWQIDISNTNGVLLQSLTGTATNGVIEAYWNLVDTNNVAHTNAAIDSEFIATVTIRPGQTNAVTKPTPKKSQREKDWPEEGKWVVAYQDFFKFDYSADNDMKDSIDAFAVTAGQYGGYVLAGPGGTNGQTYPLRYQKTNHMDTNITPAAVAKDDSLLLNFLARTNSRNFIYFGHGLDDSIAGFVSTTRIGIFVKHRYRFVFLHGCSTANGGLDKAFKINGPGKYPVSHYQATGIRPAAFCGYTVKPYYLNRTPVTINGVTYDGTIPWQVPYFVFNFLFYFDLYAHPLADAIESAIDDLPLVTGWPLQLNPGRSLTIHGYDQLGIHEYNHKSDWP